MVVVGLVVEWCECEDGLFCVGLIVCCDVEVFVFDV